jgi:dihydropteroate synthase
MGILNATPDSFSGDGIINAHDSIDNALKQVDNFIQAGAEIIDIGGESTRPGSKSITLKEELNRVIPIVKAIHLSFPNIKISIDSTKAEVTQRALECGASIVNDVSGLMKDPGMLDVIISKDVRVVIMHSYYNPHIEHSEYGGQYVGKTLENIVQIVKEDLERLATMAISRGVKAHNIILDPGIGFGKNTEENLILIDRLDEIKSLGFPVLLGASRKAFIGYTTHSVPENRLGGSIAANIIGLLRGADIFRVHDVQETLQALKLITAFRDLDKLTNTAY